MAKTKNQIIKTLSENQELIKRYGVNRLGLFGSVARGEATDSSDIDFVVEFEKKTFDAYMGLKHSLEDLFKCRVDLVLKDSIKPRLRKIIMDEVVYAEGL